MRRTRFDDWPCPIARATDLIGDWWTPLVMRELFYGRRRFDEIAESLQVPRAVLTARLNRLVDEGMITKVAYQERPVRHEYRLTEKGLAFGDVLLAMWRWAADWQWPEGDGPTVGLKSKATGEYVDPVVVDEHTGERTTMRTVRLARARATAAEPTPTPTLRQAEVPSTTE
ncbi:MAG: helix-turn-helix domain-containing protein [Actinomycetota bacterium]|nr:helix-turn-helix domain-containing protein [Actinomycetota bacterium]